jgi:hypothetical protein
LEAPWERDKLPLVSNLATPGTAHAAAEASDPAASLERRFSALQSRSSHIGIGLIGLGCAGFGAAFFGLAIAREPIPGSGWILLGGVLVAALGIGLRLREPPAVRVGARGITVGDPADAQCLPWCDVQRIHVEGSELHIDSPRGPLRLSLAAHGRAAARIVAEAAQRIGSRLELSPRAHERLPALAEGDGEIVVAGRLQVAGRRCLASGTSITFESDARLCDQCAALYHRQHVPAECKSCGRKLTGEPARAAATA